jgi:hypothetical protein
MKKLLAAGAVAGLILLGGGVAPASAATELCPVLDTGRIDVVGEQTTITLEAPPGSLITAVCIKGGTVTETFTYSPGETSVTLSLLSGKGISHYSVSYDDVVYPS